MQYTSKLKLKKPDYTDVADIADINENMDILDEQTSKLKSHTESISNPHKVTKAQVGLSDVDNTADKDKNVLSATKLTATQLTNESLNSITETGDYFGAGGNTVTDFPTGASVNGTTVGGFTLIVNQAGGSSRLQIYTSDRGVWFRIGTVGTAPTWNGWIKVYSSAAPVKINGIIFNGTSDITVPAANVIHHYQYSTKIAEGLDVYSVDQINSETVTLSVNSNYGVGDSFSLIINSDSPVSFDVTLELKFGGSIIHSGIVYDENGDSLSNFEGGVLYKVTLMEGADDSGFESYFKFEKSEANIAVINTDVPINSNDVFFLDFTYASTINDGIKLQTNYNGITSDALYLYDTNNEKVTDVETNRMYLIKKKSNGFYMMKV